VALAPLPPGTRIRLVEPAYALEPAQAADAVALLRDHGLPVEDPAPPPPRCGRLGADDAARAAMLNEAFADPAVGALLVAQGGYGCTRLLGRLDRGLIARNPKPLIGFSDVTALLVALLPQLGPRAVHGPTARTLQQEADPDSRAAFLAVLRGDRPAYQAVLERAAARVRIVRPGHAAGPLVGGNLSLLSALAGTPDAPETRGRILFLEDWNEPHYRFDRMLTQLAQAGLLDGIAGLVLGELVGVSRVGEDIAESLEARLLALAPPGIPILAGYPCGHGAANLALLLGAPYRIDGPRLLLA
jgi:muramoyltetrapeptide carboxypeptidase